MNIACVAGGDQDGKRCDLEKVYHNETPPRVEIAASLGLFPVFGTVDSPRFRPCETESVCG